MTPAVRPPRAKPPLMAEDSAGGGTLPQWENGDIVRGHFSKKKNGNAAF